MIWIPHLRHTASPEDAPNCQASFVAKGFFFASLKRSLEGAPFQKILETIAPAVVCVFSTFSAYRSKLSSHKGIKKTSIKRWFLVFFGGERGIRTPGTLRYAGFQDQCIRPLCHLSSGEEVFPESAANLIMILWYARSFE